MAFCLPVPAVRADLIAQSASYARTVYMFPTNSNTAQAGLGTALTIKLVKGSAAPVTYTPTIAELGGGNI